MTAMAGLRLDPENRCEPGNWGVRQCRLCNPLASTAVRPLNIGCPGCDGSGWTDWPAMGTSPWSEIIPGLWVGGHDFLVPVNDRATTEVTDPNRDLSHKVVSIGPKSQFDVVVSAYHRPGYEPDPPTEYHQVIFPDSRLDERVQSAALNAAELIAARVSSGKRVLSRCQAGMNRSSLMAGLAMVILGFSGEDAVQLLRARRSPWALCNEEYAQFIRGMSVQRSTVGALSVSETKDHIK